MKRKRNLKAHAAWIEGKRADRQRQVWYPSDDDPTKFVAVKVDRSPAENLLANIFGRAS